MKPLIKKVVIKVVIAIIACTLLSIILSTVIPSFNNDIAMGQLENDNFNFTLMETWRKIQNGITIVQGIIGIACFGSISYDLIKYFNGRKEI